MLQFSFGDGFSRSCCNKELVASWALGTKGPGQQPLSQAPLIMLVQTRSNIPGVSKDAACLEAYEWK